MMNLGAVRVLAMLVLVLGMAVLVPQPLQAAATQESRDLMHEVLAGDCLHLIAGYYYGDARMWERIWQANRQSVRNPNVLASGSLLLVPNATVPSEPYPDFTARAIGCGPAAARSAATEQPAAKAAAASAAVSPPSKAR
jgi:hypothetical protein